MKLKDGPNDGRLLGAAGAQYSLPSELSWHSKVLLRQQAPNVGELHCPKASAQGSGLGASLGCAETEGSALGGVEGAVLGLSLSGRTQYE